MASLEDLIKQRIADHKFDDVIRVLPLGPEPQRKELLLQDTKAAKGLGEEYEEAYVKAAGGTTQVQDAEDKLRQSARLLFQELVAKLDALSHFHYTPKPVVEDLSVRTDVAAVRMEEAAPLAVSTASMQVPAEVYKPTEGGAPKAEAELTKCVSDFELRALMYNGNISMVYHAVDRRSGVTIALKLYKRAKLTAIERHQGDVYGYLRANRGRLSEEVAVPLILEPFLSGLRLIHEQGLIHRDIKPENILLNHSFQIKIADFGLSIDSTNEVANTRLGTIDYLAPEILDCPVKQNPNDNKENPNIGYTNKVDCWSVGVLAYELLAGQPPFAAPSPQETLRRIRTKEVEYPPWFSHEALDFLRGVLLR
ncbi:protein kinase domain-containing protein [Haematococcus lacustris]|uniref:Protein kinase domain-containing protein n=1 Tax=Haematococcus lacustris TaxID=44745 RepID=A0A6A0A3T0_HAELA|nr:protein kinase domain-containing protein [Haematococcus lacustris]